MRASPWESRMTPADRRITELIAKWLASIELHLKYVELSDAAYARAQPWPRHDRPTRWVLEVARQKILELQSHCENRQAMGDSKFAESLELMAFLANLVGVQHVQRFVPIADPARENSGPAAPVEEAAPEASTVQAVPRLQMGGDETTREMPRLRTPARVAPLAAPAQPSPPPVAAAAPRVVPIISKPLARPAPEPPKLAVAPRPMPLASRPAQQPVPEIPKVTAALPRASTATPVRTAPRVSAEVATAPKPTAELKGKIIADAVRLLKWGKQWHELPDLIARIADRPAVPEVRKILRAYKSEIEAKAEGQN
jgi:hypothetical protein